MSKEDAIPYPEGFTDTLSFNPLLYKDILDRPYKTQYNEMENSIRNMEKGGINSKSKGKYNKRERNDFHCATCENNHLYKAPNNDLVKFDQYSRLTSDDMKCALFQDQSKVYTMEMLMQLVRNEQNGFNMFLKSLEPKFIQIVLNVPPGYIEYVEQQNRSKLSQFQKKINFKLSTTHFLGVAPSKMTPRCVDIWGALFSYGTIDRIKLPKVGNKIKSNVHTLTMEAKRSRDGKLTSSTEQKDGGSKISCVLLGPTKSALVCDVLAPEKVPCENDVPTLDQIETSIDTQIIESVSDPPETQPMSDSDDSMTLSMVTENTVKRSDDRTSLEESGTMEEVQESVDVSSLIGKESDVIQMKETDNFENESGVFELVNDSSECTSGQAMEEDVSTGSTDPVIGEKIIQTLLQDDDLCKVVGNDDAPTESKETVYKHIKLAVTQDQDVFITNVPVNCLGSHVETLNTDHNVIDYLMKLKIASIIAHKEALCLVFSSSPPHYEKSFTFQIDIKLLEDGSKCINILEVLPSPTMTSEIVKQSVYSQSLLSSSSKKFERVEDAANIQLMEYFQSACAQFLHSNGPSSNPEHDLKEEVDHIKKSYFVPWKTINCQTMTDIQYSVFSLGSTNFISYSEHPICLKLHGVPVDCIVYVKLQHFVQYGLQKLTHQELAYLYMKITLSNCEGAVIVHLDPLTATIINIEERSVQSLETFPFPEAMERLHSFFTQMESLDEGSYVYDHVMQQPHSVIYQQFDNTHIHSDYSLSCDYKVELSKFVMPFEFESSTLTLWQRHNIRLPLCFMPRKAGTYLCHEFLGSGHCSKSATCAFAHLTQPQLAGELGEPAYSAFMVKFKAPKDQKAAKKWAKRQNFGQVRNTRSKKKKNNPTKSSQ